MSRRDVKAQETKQRLWKSAIKLIEERGFNSVTIEDIAKDAGTSVGIFYHYFKRKQEIIQLHHQLQDQQYQQYYTQVLCSEPCASMRSDKRLREFVMHILSVSVANGREYINALYPYLFEYSKLSDNMKERPYYRLLIELIDIGKAEKTILADADTEQVVNDLTVMIRGCINDWCINSGDPNDVARYGSAIDCFIRGLKP